MRAERIVGFVLVLVWGSYCMKANFWIWYYLQDYESTTMVQKKPSMLGIPKGLETIKMPTGMVKFCYVLGFTHEIPMIFLCFTCFTCFIKMQICWIQWASPSRMDNNPGSRPCDSEDTSALHSQMALVGHLKMSGMGKYEKPSREVTAKMTPRYSQIDCKFWCVFLELRLSSFFLLRQLNVFFSETSWNDWFS